MKICLLIMLNLMFIQISTIITKTITLKDSKGNKYTLDQVKFKEKLFHYYGSLKIDKDTDTKISNFINNMNGFTAFEDLIGFLKEKLPLHRDDILVGVYSVLSEDNTTTTVIPDDLMEKLYYQNEKCSITFEELKSNFKRYKCKFTEKEAQIILFTTEKNYYAQSKNYAGSGLKKIGSYLQEHGNEILLDCYCESNDDNTQESRKVTARRLPIPKTEAFFYKLKSTGVLKKKLNTLNKLTTTTNIVTSSRTGGPNLYDNSHYTDTSGRPRESWNDSNKGTTDTLERPREGSYDSNKGNYGGTTVRIGKEILEKEDEKEDPKQGNKTKSKLDARKRRRRRASRRH